MILARQPARAGIRQAVVVGRRLANKQYNICKTETREGEGRTTARPALARQR